MMLACTLRLCFARQRHQTWLNTVRSFPASSQSSNKSQPTMKRLIDVKRYTEALHLYQRLSQCPTEYDSTLALKACAKLRDYSAGAQIHRQLSKQTLQSPFIQTALINFYMQCQRIDEAEKIFSQLNSKSIHVYGAMLQGYISNGKPERVLDLFERMPLEPDAVILTILFNACGELSTERAKQRGKGVLAHLPQAFRDDSMLMNSAIDMLMKFGDVADAEQVFQSVTVRTKFMCGTMMKGYLMNNQSKKALDLCERFPCRMDAVLYTIVYKACAALANDRAMMMGKKLLTEMPQRYYDDIILLTAATHMLMKVGDVASAEELFSRVRKPSLACLGAMINGYKINDQPKKCLKLSQQLVRFSITPDVPISLALIHACSQVRLRPTCERIVQLIPSDQLNDPRIASSLIDMWGKAGAVSEASRVFHSARDKNNFTYTTMINSYGRNGMGLEAVDLYQQMPSDLRNSVTDVCVLNACSHSGLVEQAQSIYSQISKKTEHIVTTMIDCYSRMSMFDEAQQLIDQHERSHAPDLVMYTALLSGVRNRRQSALAQRLYDRMQSLFPQARPDLISASILVSNTYSAIDDHAQSQAIHRDRIQRYGSKVMPGITQTEVNGEIEEFRAHNNSHPRESEIRAEITRMAQDLRADGHEYDSSWVTRPLRADETVESALCGHSEKWALAFNFIQTPVPAVIELSKNLRVCGDCHEATKRLARIRQVEIVVGDANRNHRFLKSGECTCQDHF